MANIKERINKLHPYFKGMQVDESNGEQIIYVMIAFPPKWIIQPDTEVKYDITIGGGENGILYFCASLEQGFDVIFDAIDYNVEKMKIAVERAQLFKQKAKELQDLFSDETISIDSLRTLDFTYKGKKKKPLPIPKVQEEIPEEKEEIKEETEQEDE